MTRTRSLIITGLLVSGAALPAAILPGQAALADRPTASAADPGGDTALGAEFFHIQWSADTRRDGHVRITGYVYNDRGEPADNVVLRIDELDSSGQVLRTVLKPLDDTIDALGRAYFAVQLDARAASYNVGVDSFDFLDR